MSDDLRQQLTEALDEATWAWLEPHFQRDVVIVVAPHLALVDVGLAIANNQTMVVQDWITAQFIAKPSQAQYQQWHLLPTHKFTALIVQPYILIQEKSIQHLA